MQRFRVRNVGMKIEILYTPLSFLVWLSGCHLEALSGKIFQPSLHCLTGKGCALISECSLHIVKDESGTIKQGKEKSALH